MTKTWPVTWFAKQMECTYKPGQLRSAFAVNADEDDVSKFNLYSEFLPKGFQSSRYSVIGLKCDSCSACVPLRIRLDDFEFSLHARRLMRRNEDLTFTFLSPSQAAFISDEQYALLTLYRETRHPGDNALWSSDWAGKRVVGGHSGLMEIRDTDGRLIAGVIYDHLYHALNGYYTFYDPSQSSGHRSLGTLCQLKIIAHAKELGLQHLYIGNWIDGHSKLAYKQRLHNVEALRPDGKWVDFDPVQHQKGPDNYAGALPKNISVDYIPD